VFPDDQVQHYEGDRGEERLIRTEFLSGRIQFYEGDRGEERLIRTEFPSGRIQFYEGDQDKDDSEGSAAFRQIKIHVVEGLRSYTQFNRIRFSQGRNGRNIWHGKYKDGREEPVSFSWICENFKSYFVERCKANPGEWLYVPVGKEKSTFTSGEEENLNGMSEFGTKSPLTTPEVRFQSGEGEDYCLSYGAASAVSYLGDVKLPKLLVDKAGEIEQIERQLEEVRSIAVQIGWTATRISSVDKVKLFNPLTACPYGSVLVIHIREDDGSENHSISISLDYIFDANRKHALPLTQQSLDAIGYNGIVSATLLTPKKKIAEALARKRKRGE
jgi:hypothetical protein